MNFRNLNLALLHQLDSKGRAAAIMHKEGGHYKNVSYDDLKDIAFCVAQGLMIDGLQFRDRVAIISNTRPEWVYADLGSLFSGAVISAIYPTTPEEETAFIINDIQARYLFVENTAQVNKLMKIRDRIPSVEKIYVFDTNDLNRNGYVDSFTTLMNRGANWQDDEANIRAVSEMVEPHDTLTIIYTSGTTGLPKGVVLSHFNYLVTIQNLLTHSPQAFIQVERNLSFLPLAHALERIGGYYILLYNGRTIAYAESIEKMIDNFAEVKPDFIAGVPRVYEKIYARIMGGLKDASPFRKALFNWAMKIGKEAMPYKIERKSMPSWLLWRYNMAHMLVFKKVKERFGGRVKFFVSGGAPLNPEIAKFFYALDILILEGWGATEGTAPYTFNRPEEFKFGTVGKAVHGVEIRRAEDGELLVKGPNIFRGYYNLPEATAESFTDDGFFHTGDIGEIDENGWVTITDRKKQLLITAGGKNVAPAFIQQQLCHGGLIEHAHIHGDNRKYLVALLTIERDGAKKFAAEHGIKAKTHQEIIEHPKLQHKVKELMDAANEKLAQYMKVKYYRIVPTNFTVESGELTPTLKIKTNLVNRKYADLIDSMYERELVDDLV